MLWQTVLYNITPARIFFFIDLDELVYVNAALAKQANHWLRIGESLGVSAASLDIIRANHPAANVGRCLIEMLAEWLKNSDLPTWSEVVQATKKIDAKAAEDIAKKSKGIMYMIIQQDNQLLKYTNFAFSID